MKLEPGTAAPGGPTAARSLVNSECVRESKRENTESERSSERESERGLQNRSVTIVWSLNGRNHSMVTKWPFSNHGNAAPSSPYRNRSNSALFAGARAVRAELLCVLHELDIVGYYMD